MRLILLAVLLFSTTTMNAQWVQTNGPYGGDVRCLAVSGSNIFAGTDGGDIFLSSNNGNSWSAVNNGLTNGIVHSIAIIGSNIFAGTGYGLFLSTNNGSSWNAVNNGMTNRLVSSIAISGSNIFAGTPGGGIFLSTDTGSSWTAINNGLTETYVYSLAISGSNIFAGTYGGGVFLSTNNGSSWSAVNIGSANTSVRSLAISGSNIFAGTYGGGVFLSTNNGSSWSAVNNGLTNTQVWSLAISGSNIFAGTIGGGIFLSTNNGSSWNAVNKGLTNATVYSIAISGSNIFANGSGMFLSTDTGSSWTAINNGLTNTSVSSIAISGSNIFAGTRGGGIFLSTDTGSSWTAVNNGLANTSVSSLAISGSNIFAGTYGGGVFLSTNNGSSWTASTLTNTHVYSIAISGSNIFAGTSDGLILSTNNGSSWTASTLTNTWVYSIATSGSNIFAGTNRDGIFLSTNNGTSWNAVNNGLTNPWVYSLAISGSNIFAGTYGGLFLSTNNGSSWTASTLTNTAVYSIAISGSNIFAGTAVKGVWRSRIPSSIIKGKVFNDKNSNCIFDSSDAGLSVHGHSPWMVKATKAGDAYYSTPDLAGDYSLNVDSGTYIVSLINPTQVYSLSCPPTSTYQVTLVSDTDTISNIHFAVQSQISCSQMRTSVSSSFFRPCMNTTLTIDYCNEGTIPETSAVVKVMLPQELTLTSSSIPWNSSNGNTYSFNIGTVQEGAFGSFTISVDVLCNPTELMNATLCVKSEISPAEFCSNQLQDTIWDKSSVSVTGTCQGDTLICFRIRNSGSTVDGNMQGTSQWRLYADNILIQQGTFQLLGQQDTVMCFPANGQTLRLEADQRPGHPGRSRPRESVERCGILSIGQTYSLGQILPVPLDNGLPFSFEYCDIVRTSYDPNDKQVVPSGITGNNFTANEDRLEYKINFQNTGNDTAFTIVVRDTLDLNTLDISTLVLGTVSHPYEFFFEGPGVMVWRFENILLPDSFVNEPLSHGYVSFSIDQLPGLALGTQVSNKADIYFDFNPPMTTDPVFNTVCEVETPTIVLMGNASFICTGDNVTFLSSITHGGSAPVYQWKVNGNPVGLNDSIFSSSTLTNGDTISCELLSDFLCALPASVSSNKIIMVVHTPVQPIINFNAGQLESTPAISYQWYVDGQAISGATSQTHIALVNGSYEVETVDSNGCTAISVPCFVSTVNVAEISGSKLSATLYPNPATQEAILTLHGTLPGMLQVSLISPIGQNSKVLFEKEVMQNKAIEIPIDTKALDPGVYTVQVRSGKDLMYLRLLVVK